MKTYFKYSEVGIFFLPSNFILLFCYSIVLDRVTCISSILRKVSFNAITIFHHPQLALGVFILTEESM